MLSFNVNGSHLTMKKMTVAQAGSVIISAMLFLIMIKIFPFDRNMEIHTATFKGFETM